ncbi:MAG: hypothetical protein ABSH00_01030 [Bryobacteraceae bacterium]|jgi:hypothetical protein
MRVLKLAVPAAIILAGLVMSTVASYGTPAYMKATGQKACTTCHAKIGPMADMKKDPNLNATGKCFKAQTDKTTLTDACKNAK